MVFSWSLGLIMYLCPQSPLTRNNGQPRLDEGNELLLYEESCVSPFGERREWGDMTECCKITDPEAAANSELLFTTSHTAKEELVWEMGSSELLLVLL